MVFITEQHWYSLHVQGLKILLALSSCIFFGQPILRLMFTQILSRNARGFIYACFWLYGLQLHRKSPPESKVKMSFSEDLFLKRNTKVCYRIVKDILNWKKEEPRATKKTDENNSLTITFSAKFTFKEREVKIKVHCYFHKPSLVGCRYLYLLKAVAKCLFILKGREFQSAFEKNLPG